MAIVALKKLTLCGLAENKSEVLKKLQLLGCSHLITLNKPVFSTEVTTKKLTENSVYALKYLMQCTKKRLQIHDHDQLDLNKIVTQVLQVQSDLRNLTDQRDFLVYRIKEVSPWGDFKLSSAADLGGIQLWFYIIPKHSMKLIKGNLIYQVVHTDNTHCFVVVLAEQEPVESSVPVPRTHTGTSSLSVLKQNLQNIELSIEDKQAERQSLTRWITLIAQDLVKNEDAVALKVANSLCFTDQNIFAIQSWVPVNKMTELESFAANNELVLLIEAIQQHDHPPTLLQNADYLAGGEEIVKFYQTPAYNSWDPSSVLFFSFAFFFAMILSDAGYASFFGLILAIKWNQFGKTVQGQRLRMLALFTIMVSIVWGILTGGYFGFSPPQDSFVASLKLLDINDFDSMMRLSIAIGVAHIILANFIKAAQFNSRSSTVSALGWILLTVGGFTLWLVKSNVVASLYTNIAYGLLIMGMVALLFFANDNLIKRPVDWLWKAIDGLKNVSKVTKIFGDILSYMRLFALGLASASLALTFNQLAEQFFSSASGLGLLIGLLILVLGHALNIMLCLMSGVVHGLRLNFIEFYNWSVSDEGYAFKTFSKKGEH